MACIYNGKTKLWLALHNATIFFVGLLYVGLVGLQSFVYYILLSSVYDRTVYLFISFYLSGKIIDKTKIN